jgi:hypothetical protein
MIRNASTHTAVGVAEVFLEELDELADKVLLVDDVDVDVDVDDDDDDDESDADDDDAVVGSCSCNKLESTSSLTESLSREVSSRS